jgi:hypothetical protein
MHSSSGSIRASITIHGVNSAPLRKRVFAGSSSTSNRERSRSPERRQKLASQVSIHADHWIRRMALENRMIEPFEEKLVRRTGDAPERSFVDIQAKSCLVPPNSFALARSVEYFRIPAMCLPCASARALTRAAVSS